MKIAILADVHGNLQALHAVCDDVDRWRPDAVLVAGDIVNRGPCSAECYDLVLARRERDGWIVIRGNHEEYVMERACAGAPRPPDPYDVFAAVDWCRRSLGSRVAELAGLPTEASLPTPAGEVFMTHGQRCSAPATASTRTPRTRSCAPRCALPARCSRWATPTGR